SLHARSPSVSCWPGWAPGRRSASPSPASERVSAAPRCWRPTNYEITTRSETPPDEYDSRSQRTARRADGGGHQRVAGPAAPLPDRDRRAAPDDRRGVAARRDLQPPPLREGHPTLRG